METIHQWTATYRCDNEEVFTTDTFVYHLPTTVLSEAARLIEREIGNNTLIRLERSDV